MKFTVFLLLLTGLASAQTTKPLDGTSMGPWRVGQRRFQRAWWNAKHQGD